LCASGDNPGREANALIELAGPMSGDGKGCGHGPTSRACSTWAKENCRALSPMLRLKADWTQRGRLGCSWPSQTGPSDAPA